MTCGGPWVGMIPEEALGADFEDFRNLIAENFAPSILEDRRQEIVIIGSDLKKEAITEALDACLLKKEENTGENIGAQVNHEVADSNDIEENGWKFGWKYEGDEYPLPEWPNYKDQMEHLTSNEAEGVEEDETDDIQKAKIIKLDNDLFANNVKPDVKSG